MGKSGRLIQGRLIIPGHPEFRIVEDFPGVFQDPGQIIKRIYLRKVAGLNDAHENITYMRSQVRFVKQRIFPVHDCAFETSFHNVVVQRASGNLKKSG